ncbi:MAG: T9SS type A sorting domain-containing protein [Bacteroidota bacterium]
MKKVRLIGVVVLGLLLIVGAVYVKTPKENIPLEKSKKQIVDKNYQKFALEKIEAKRAGKRKVDAPEMHAEIMRELRTKEGDSEPKYGPNQLVDEYIKAKSRMARARVEASNFNFIERGPGNVAGRTRGLIVDPDDPARNTWLAGSASGGIWKTTDGGANWTFVSEDIPNLGTNTLAMSEANTSVYYAGTGEHFTRDIDGSGVFKSLDKGESWFQIADPATYPDLKTISRIIVNPSDENHVIITSRNSVWSSSLEGAIYRTFNGGDTWERVRTSTFERYDDIVFDPSDFNILYVAIDEVGVIKSTDGGTTWEDATSGLVADGRIEIGISNVNTNRLWASVEGSLSGTGSDLFVTSDGGETWNLAVNGEGANEDFLGGQGWFDNTVLPHPFDEDLVYVGGVNTWQFELASSGAQEITTKSARVTGQSSFLEFINFGGELLGGAIEIGTGLSDQQLKSVEIRFGQGGQKAHRFTVGGQGAGVPDANYVYEDYVDVPFQVWDIDNDVQLMASFRDQQEDGEWNLIESNTEGDPTTHSREYLYVHDLTYSEEANPSIGSNGGVGVSQLYFTWAVLAPGSTFDPSDLPISSIQVNVASNEAFIRQTTNISDAYNEFGGLNSFPQASRTVGLHPDQHSIIFKEVDNATQSFQLLIGNDGGVYQTVKSSSPGLSEGDFDYKSFGYNTTQFYGADKAPNENRFIGGMQDNGTWFHPNGIEGGFDQPAVFAIGGDGFEVLWHSTNANKIIGGSQFNNFDRTLDGGGSWNDALEGFDDNGPFISRLAHNKTMPDRIFTVGRKGVWKSEDFGGNWSLSTMSDEFGWSQAFTNATDVEVSYANPDIIWAGARLSSTGRLHVSTDGGANFNPVENYDVFNMGGISGIGTHPSEPNTAFAIFSFAGFPKILRTNDLGQTWEDISGFDGSGDRGFPDVAVNTVFVFPNENDRIWAGTEIGIVESLDNGESWTLLDTDFPNVNTYDFKLVGNVLVIATYGRGIWSTEIPDFTAAPEFVELQNTIDKTAVLTLNIEEDFDSLKIFVGDQLFDERTNVTAGQTTLTISNTSFEGLQNMRFEGFIDGNRFFSAEEVFLLVPSSNSAGFGTRFRDSDDNTAFLGVDMTISASAGPLSGGFLLTSTPYEDNANYFSYLKTPIVVSGTNSLIQYRDIALVATGDNGSEFGQEAFSDYVAVEASIDGISWTTLKGYDASAFPEWQEAYDERRTFNASLLKDQVIDLRDFYEVGDEILIRFRLFSDGDGITAAGWAINQLFIQEEVILSSIDEKDLQVYPNPIEQEAIVYLGNMYVSSVVIHDLNGKVVDRFEVNSTEKFSWNRKSLKDGIYLMSLVGENEIFTKRIYLQ